MKLRARTWVAVALISAAFCVGVGWATVVLEGHNHLRASLAAVSTAVAALFTAVTAVAALFAARGSQAAAEGARQAAQAMATLSATHPPDLTIELWPWLSPRGLTLNANIFGDDWRRFDDIRVQWRIRLDENPPSEWHSVQIPPVAPKEQRSDVYLADIDFRVDEQPFEIFWFEYRAFATDVDHGTVWSAQQQSRTKRENFNTRMNMRLFTFASQSWHIGDGPSPAQSRRGRW